MDRYKALIAVAMDSGAICFKSFYFFYFKYIKIIFLIFNINTSKSPKHTKDINLKTFNKFKNKKSTLQPYYQKMPTTKEKIIKRHTLVKELVKQYKLKNYLENNNTVSTPCQNQNPCLMQIN
jgi:mevalonate kinase